MTYSWVLARRALREGWRTPEGLVTLAVQPAEFVTKTSKNGKNGPTHTNGRGA